MSNLMSVYPGERDHGAFAEAELNRTLKSDLWRDKLARRFSAVLREWLTPDEMKEVNRRNTPEIIARGLVCHSHDFCDANVAMAEAFESVCGREVDLQSDDDLALWSSAWGLAKNALFYPEPMGQDGRHAYATNVYCDGKRFNSETFRDWYDSDEQAIRETTAFFNAELKHGVKEVQLADGMLAVIMDVCAS